jgi:hypothetical protein
MQVFPHAKALLAERLCVRTGETGIAGLWLAFCRPRGSSFAGCNRRRVGPAVFNSDALTWKALKLRLIKEKT